MPNPNQLLPEVKAFLDDSPIRMFIGGEWVEAADGGTFDTLDPGDGSKLATVVEGQGADIDRAVAAAREAFRKSGWSTMSANERAVLLHRLADLVDRNRAVLGPPVDSSGGQRIAR